MTQIFNLEDKVYGKAIYWTQQYTEDFGSSFGFWRIMCLSDTLADLGKILKIEKKLDNWW